MTPLPEHSLRELTSDELIAAYAELRSAYQALESFHSICQGDLEAAQKELDSRRAEIESYKVEHLRLMHRLYVQEQRLVDFIRLVSNRQIDPVYLVPHGFGLGAPDLTKVG